MCKALLSILFVVLVCSLGFAQINQPGGGGGSGTVSANNGSAGAVANYAAAGGSTTVGPDATLIDNGTRWVGTEPLALGDGTVAAPAFTFSGATGTGMSRNGANLVFGVAGGAQGAFNTANNFELQNSSFIAWSGSSDPTAAPSATLAQETGKLFSFGIGGDETGLVRTSQGCRVTADITLPVNTATTICSWSLPGLAKAWAWQCQIPWVISAGTGTNTLAVIANPSQTPTGTTNGSAEIKTTNANAATEATTAISASGATTLLTSGTITPAATVFMSSTSGTVLAAGTAGTFSIQMTAAGTTATAAAKAGATCLLY